MNPQFRHVAIASKYQSNAGNLAEHVQHNHQTRVILHDIALFLTQQGCQVSFEKKAAMNLGIDNYPVLAVADIGKHCDLCLVVGGDGTMLGIGRRLACFDVPLIGINQGRLGFMTDIRLADYQNTLTPMLRGDYEEDWRSLIHAHVVRDAQIIFDALAMNDVVINRGATSGMLELRIKVDQHFVATQRADGLIISTPTGSTAYALSAGGPMLSPSLPGWVIVPIAPHTLTNRPLVIGDGGEVELELVAGKGASANFDMQSLEALVVGDRIVVRRSAHRVRFLHPKGWNYFDTLREKLYWNEGGS